MDIKEVTHIDNIKLSEDRKSVIIIDQTRLPNHIEYISLDTPEGCYEAILKLRVRGAPAIGIFAGYSMYVLARKMTDLPYGKFLQEFRKQKEYINSCRPTAVNLSWALRRMEKVVTDNAVLPVPEIVDLLGEECVKIHKEDIDMCRRISENGLSLLHEGEGILTQDRKSVV